jgi:acyl-coenzyme A synthetase/AMP-(fatty) acid ligase
MIFSLDDHTSDKALFEASSGRWWSYAGLRSLVDEWREPLAQRRKSLLFNFCGNDVRSMAAWLASVDCGNATALLDDSLAADSKARLIELYQPDFVSTAEDFSFPGYVAMGKSLWRRTIAAELPLHPDLALLLSTSGSTGSPRFVRLTRRNVEANAESISQVLDIGRADCAITSLPIHYSYGLSVLNTHLLRGASIALTGQGLLEPGFWQTFRAAECTSFAGVPYHYQILNRLDPDRLNIPSLHTMTQAGGKMDPALISKFSGWIGRRGGRFFVMYGQTEATARITILPSGAVGDHPDSVGKSIPGGQVSIRINGETSIEPNRAGELIYRGPNVMMGYAGNREDLALGDELNGVLCTGDMARIDEDGYVFIDGRAGRDAKVFGLRINLDEVENMLRLHGPVAVVAKGEKLFIYCEHGDDQIFAGYRSDLAKRLRIHHSAFYFERIERLPLTGNGKIDYQKLAGVL